ncbi:MAG: hypothetical protein Q7S75_02225 [bacterium]|nr:hypothetical protein [bacterium]
MIFFFSGSDTKKAREEMNKEIMSTARASLRIVRITDANSVPDLQASLQGSGLFGEQRVVVFDSVFSNDDMHDVLFQSLSAMKESAETFFIFEASPDAETRRTIGKYAANVKRHDAPNQKKDNSIFALANAMRRADKKALWVGYQRELAKGKAPEAIHGVLFWGAKDMLLRSKTGTAENALAKKLVAELAELPHEARRHYFDLEYALERFVLS